MKLRDSKMEFNFQDDSYNLPVGVSNLFNNCSFHDWNQQTYINLLRCVLYY